MKSLVRNCTLAIGGERGRFLNTVEVIGSDDFHLPHNLPPLDLPVYIKEHSSVITNENKLLIIGGSCALGSYHETQ